MNLPLSFLENEMIMMILYCLPKWLTVTSWLSPSRQWHWPPAVTSHDRIWGGMKNLVKLYPMNHGYLTSFLTTSAIIFRVYCSLFVMLIVIHLVSCLSWGFISSDDDDHWKERQPLPSKCFCSVCKSSGKLLLGYWFTLPPNDCILCILSEKKWRISATRLAKKTGQDEGKKRNT